MTYIIGILLAAKGIVFVTGLFALTASKIEIAPPQIVVAGNEVRATCAVRNAYPRDLRKLAQSGTDITIYLFVDVKLEVKDAKVAGVVAENHLLFDPVAAIYTVRRSSTRDTLRFASLDSAIEASSAFGNLGLLPVGLIDPQARYAFSIYAVLGKVRVEALKGNEIDLMYYWNYKRPILGTQPVPGAAFLQDVKGSSRDATP